jgi:hypothetical protein
MMIMFLRVVLIMVKYYFLIIIKINHQYLLILNFKVKKKERNLYEKFQFYIDIKMDWSSLGEILAVGGHKRLNDSNYINQIIFYTRRGEFLHRVQIPQMVCIYIQVILTYSCFFFF